MTRHTASLAALAAVASAAGQTQCGERLGPDLIAGELGSVANYAGDGVVDALAVNVTFCNLGTGGASFAASTPAHPVVASGLFRWRALADGTERFEQIGQSWVFHAFSALQGGACCQCTPMDIAHLGPGCSSPETASIMGTQSALGPRWQVNPHSGTFAYPPANPSYSGSVARRLQVAVGDLAPSSSTVRYILEQQIVAADDAAAGNAINNNSHRQAIVTGSAAVWSFSLTSSVERQRPALLAWQDLSSRPVDVVTVSPADDGTILVAAQAVQLPSGRWHYEYAVQNLTSDRGIGSFEVALAPGVAVSSPGFHDVAYHSGDGLGNVNFDGTDWPVTLEAGAIRWETQPFAENPAANALRWGTLYNFRFEADAAPIRAERVGLGLFKPGIGSHVAAGPLLVPGGRPGDLDADGDVDLADLSRVLASFGRCAGDEGFEAAADLDRDGCVAIGDLTILLAAYGN